MGRRRRKREARWAEEERQRSLAAEARWQAIWMARPPRIKPGDTICPVCGEDFLIPTRRLMLTSYPIFHVYDCPTCDTTFFQLYDGVLCSEKEFNERIHNNYV